MSQKYVYFFLLPLLIACNSKREPFELVDPFIGTGGHGHTFPGATAPFGMIQMSPDSRLEGWDGCSGYHYSDSIIYGFSQTHLSGTGVSDYGDFLLTPQSGNLKFFRGNDSLPGYRLSFSHDNESAGPGWYKVRFDNKIKVGIVAGKRGGIYHIQYPEGDQYLSLDLEHRDQLLDYEIRIHDNRTITAYRRSSAWARDQRVFLALRFNRRIKTIIGEEGEIHDIKKTNGLRKLGFEFEANESSQLEVSVGLSSVNHESAIANLEKEIGDKTLEQFQAYSKALWTKELGKIEVKGSREDRIKFYTSLYHSMIAPNLYSDVDGSYRGRDLLVHQAGHRYYTVFSLWDTYRALHPLLTIIDSARTVDFIRTFILQYQQGGTLPVWELSANETMCMIGYHSVPVIVDAVMKGYHGFDQDLALEASIFSSNLNHLGLRDYKNLGFIPAGSEPESVSKTLEYAFDDWCIALLAQKLGKDSLAAIYNERAQYWKNLYDPETKFFRARINNGYVTPFIPEEVNFHYTEANAWHYSMYVPQHLLEWIGYLGGPDELENFLDRLFTADEKTEGRKQADITGLIGQYAHGNEPSQHMAYLYNYSNSPWKTQKYVRTILNDLYSVKPEGLPGNEDCGQMSAWFVLSSLGFYPVNPASNQYLIGCPLFEESRIILGGNRVFQISAPNSSDENPYIQGAILNGEPLERNWITHQEIMEGGLLEFEMGAEPSQWGSGSFKLNPGESDYVPVPFLKRDTRSFKDSSILDFGHIDPDVKIYYSINKSRYKGYEAPFSLNETALVRFYAEKEMLKSKVLESRLVKIPSERNISIKYAFANQYSAGGNDALIDGIHGGPKFATGDWQGYQGVNLEAVIDLGKETEVKSLSMGFLQDWNSWIFFPKQVQFYSSNDSVEWDLIDLRFTMVDPKEEGSLVQHFEVKKRFNSRFIKVVAINRGINPPWHKAPGDTCWIFADELEIQ